MPWLLFTPAPFACTTPIALGFGVERQSPHIVVRHRHANKQAVILSKHEQHRVGEYLGSPVVEIEEFMLGQNPGRSFPAQPSLVSIKAKVSMWMINVDSTED